MRLRKRKWMDEILFQRKDILYNEDSIEEALDLNKDKKIVLEIGSGKGGFIYQMALNFPQEQFVGVEMQRNALAIALKYIKENSCNNLRLLNCDANKIFMYLKDESIDTIFLNFSDPWPKKKQHKRRLTYNTFLKEYFRILKKDGLLIFKTDNDNLFNDSLKYIEESDFKLVDCNFDYDGKDNYDAQTEYEIKFRQLGVKIKRLIAKKEI